MLIFGGAKPNPALDAQQVQFLGRHGCQAFSAACCSDRDEVRAARPYLEEIAKHADDARATALARAALGVGKADEARSAAMHAALAALASPLHLPAAHLLVSAGLQAMLEVSGDKAEAAIGRSFAKEMVPHLQGRHRYAIEAALKAPGCVQADELEESMWEFKRDTEPVARPAPAATPAMPRPDEGLFAKPAAPSKPNFYTTLGLSRTATDAEVKHRYRDLAKRYHPDVNHAPGAEATFKTINNAFSTLMDPEKRRAYDATLSSASRLGSSFR